MPLADLLRPTSLDTYVGQAHLTGPSGPIRQAVTSTHVPSMIFWGPPGSGKTTLAKIIAREVDATFHYLSAVAAGKADVKRVVEEARSPQLGIGEGGGSRETILFLDEIHRFNKAQQDYLLPYVEDGTLILIGATTENPSFSVISALLSRAQVFVLKQHTHEDIAEILTRGVQRLDSMHQDRTVAFEAAALEYIGRYAQGDARKALNLLEAAYLQADPGDMVSLEQIEQVLQSAYLRYDKHGDEHYDTISAFIKSMRASDADAALYYLARMIEAGEDPLFIARRMVVFASEDIGMAQPTALVVANEVFRACETIGYPECGINLAHGVVYLSKADKDRRAYDGLRAAQADVQAHGNLPIPLKLRNAATTLMKEQQYGVGYEMYPEKGTNLMPDKLAGKKYFK